MPRDLDHLVLCVNDLEAAQRRFRSFGFTVTPPADHPFGTRFRLVLLADNFIELLAVADCAPIPPAEPGGFSFGAHNRDFLADGEGISMLAFKGSDARADARRFVACRLGAYAPFDFSRNATLPDGTSARVAFSLAFASDPGLPRLAFFTCQHHQPRALLWQPDYQRHANGASRIVETILATPDPAAHRRFFEQLTEGETDATDGMLSIGPPDQRITLLRPDRLAERFPEFVADDGAPRFAAYRVAVADLRAVEQQLRDGAIRHRSTADAIVIAPASAFGVAVEFTGHVGERSCRP
jgi:hypothetical protein